MDRALAANFGLSRGPGRAPRRSPLVPETRTHAGKIGVAPRHEQRDAQAPRPGRGLPRCFDSQPGRPAGEAQRWAAAASAATSLPQPCRRRRHDCRRLLLLRRSLAPSPPSHQDDWHTPLGTVAPATRPPASRPGTQAGAPVLPGAGAPLTPQLGGLLAAKESEAALLRQQLQQLTADFKFNLRVSPGPSWWVMARH